MPILHVLSFAYKPSAPASVRDEAFQRLMDLRTACVVPESESASSSVSLREGEDAPWNGLQPGAPYISDLKGGRANISPEGKGKGFDHTFVFTFPTRESVRFYLEEDPAHLDFVSWVGQHIDDVYVYDFEC